MNIYQVHYFLKYAVTILKSVEPDFKYIPFKYISIKDYNKNFWAEIRWLKDGKFNLSLNAKWFSQIKDKNTFNKALLNTLIHELIHMAVPEDPSHGDKWLEIASRINNKYPELNITASTPLETYVDTKKKAPKWKLVCPKCNSEYWYYRKPNESKVNNEYGCPNCVDYSKGKAGYTKFNIIKCGTI